MLRFAVSVDKDISAILGQLAWEGWPGTRVVLLFAEEDDYLAYSAAFYSNGQVLWLLGAQLNQGYPHVAMLWSEEKEVLEYLIHELTHTCLAHLPLPHWLNEGMAESLRRRITWSREHRLASLIPGRQPRSTWTELAEQHRRHWNEQTLQEFWAGASFYQNETASCLSYSLADALVQRLSERQPHFEVFVRHAQFEDAGQVAALEWLGLRLEDEMTALLGPGNWRPSITAMSEIREAMTKPALVTSASQNPAKPTPPDTRPPAVS
ncbi:MAG: hypothetical protein HZA90_20875 [Verrucomicrobia bacterium]|nr:hypothetical protein [Verrucomicrobiota bacterium]